MLGQAKKSKVVVRKSRRNPRIRHDGNREWITDIEAINAAGEAIPPFVILKGKSVLSHCQMACWGAAR